MRLSAISKSGFKCQGHLRRREPMAAEGQHHPEGDTDSGLAEGQLMLATQTMCKN